MHKLGACTIFARREGVIKNERETKVALAHNDLPLLVSHSVVECMPSDGYHSYNKGLGWMLEVRIILVYAEENSRLTAAANDPETTHPEHDHSINRPVRQHVASRYLFDEHPYFHQNDH